MQALRCLGLALNKNMSWPKTKRVLCGPSHVDHLLERPDCQSLARSAATAVKVAVEVATSSL